MKSAVTILMLVLVAIATCGQVQAADVLTAEITAPAAPAAAGALAAVSGPAAAPHLDILASIDAALADTKPQAAVEAAPTPAPAAEPAPQVAEAAAAAEEQPSPASLILVRPAQQWTEPEFKPETAAEAAAEAAEAAEVSESVEADDVAEPSSANDNDDSESFEAAGEEPQWQRSGHVPGQDASSPDASIQIQRQPVGGLQFQFQQEPDTGDMQMQVAMPPEDEQMMSGIEQLLAALFGGDAELNDSPSSALGTMQHRVQRQELPGGGFFTVESWSSGGDGDAEAQQQLEAGDSQEDVARANWMQPAFDQPARMQPVAGAQAQAELPPSAEEAATEAAASPDELQDSELDDALEDSEQQQPEQEEEEEGEDAEDQQPQPDEDAEGGFEPVGTWEPMPTDAPRGFFPPSIERFFSSFFGRASSPPPFLRRGLMPEAADDDSDMMLRGQPRAMWGDLALPEDVPSAEDAPAAQTEAAEAETQPRRGCHKGLRGGSPLLMRMHQLLHGGATDADLFIPLPPPPSSFFAAPGSGGGVVGRPRNTGPFGGYAGLFASDGKDTRIWNTPLDTENGAPLLLVQSQEQQQQPEEAEQQQVDDDVQFAQLGAGPAAPGAPVFDRSARPAPRAPFLRPLDGPADHGLPPPPPPPDREHDGGDRDHGDRWGEHQGPGRHRSWVHAHRTLLIVGGMVMLVLLAAGVFVCVRRRKRRAAAAQLEGLRLRQGVLLAPGAAAAAGPAPAPAALSAPSWPQFGAPSAYSQPGGLPPSAPEHAVAVQAFPQAQAQSMQMYPQLSRPLLAH